MGHLHEDVIWLQVPECFGASYCIRYFFFCEESLVRDTNLHNKDCSEMHSGCCSQMTSPCKCSICVIVAKGQGIPRDDLLLEVDNQGSTLLHMGVESGTAKVRHKAENKQQTAHSVYPQNRGGNYSGVHLGLFLVPWRLFLESDQNPFNIPPVEDNSPMKFIFN